MTAAGRTRRTVLLPALILVAGSLMLRAQSPAPKPIALEDYAKFKRITGAAISGDGKWMHYTVTPNDGDATLFVKSLDSDKVYEVRARRQPGLLRGRTAGSAYFIRRPRPKGAVAWTRRRAAARARPRRGARRRRRRRRDRSR